MGAARGIVLFGLSNRTGAPRCLPVPVPALHGANSPRGIHRWLNRRGTSPCQVCLSAGISLVLPAACPTPRDHPAKSSGKVQGYHSNETMVGFAAIGVRSYVSEPDRGRRHWKGQAAARDAVYANRRRIRGARGQRLLRQRGELLRTAQRASLRDRPNAPRPSARASQHPETAARPSLRRQSRVAHAAPDGRGTPRSLQGAHRRWWRR